MDFWNSIPSWIENASAAVLLFLLAALFIWFIVSSVRSVLPFVRELNEDRKRLADEQREFYEETVIPNLQKINTSLEGALSTQRELYEGKLDALERERNTERNKLVQQIKDLTTQVQALTDRITKLEQEGKTKDEEIARLKAQLAEVTAERDTALAKLEALPKTPDVKLADKPATEAAA